MIGAVAAVRRWMTMNHEDRLADSDLRTQTIVSLLQGINGLRVEPIDNIIGHQPFGLNLHVDASVTGMTAQDVVDQLKQGDPPIWTRVKDWEDFIAIHVFGLNEGEEKIVGQRIADLFKR